VKPPPFRYAAPTSVEEVLGLLAANADDDPRVLAGGQSLVPLMNFRLAQPGFLVDLRLVEALTTLRTDGDVLVIGGQHSASNTAERYDWRRREFVYAGVLVEPRLAAAAAAFPDGSVALVGGLPDSPSRIGFAPTANVERWDARTNTWSELPGIAAGRALGALVVSGGEAYLVGAAGRNEEADPRVERLRVQ